jgi:hypothetical protein
MDIVHKGDNDGNNDEDDDDNNNNNNNNKAFGALNVLFFRF